MKAERDFIPKKKTKLTTEEIAKGILAGDRVMLGMGITLTESSNPGHREQAFKLLNLCAGKKDTVRIGITGVPGVGKSTFIESFGQFLVRQGHKVAVLAIDPSSAKSRGSILGDKTRMEGLSIDPHAFIRPAPTGGNLGGVADGTRASIVLCEAAGFDVVIVETVGVGQSETDVSNMVDIFILLMLAGAGDELQGIKRGIMELADFLIINKADGDNMKKAKESAAEYRRALHLFPPSEKGWRPETMTASGLSGEGMEKLWQKAGEFRKALEKNGQWEKQRNAQQLNWFEEACKHYLLELVFGKNNYRQIVAQYMESIQSGKTNEFAALFDFSKNVTTAGD